MGAPGALLPAEIPTSLLLETVVETKIITDYNETIKDLSLVLDTVAVTQEVPQFDEVPFVCQSKLEAFCSYCPQPSEKNVISNTKPSKDLPLDYSVYLHSSSISEDLSPAQEKKVKDVSKYVISAAKNPEFAQKLHAVLLESGASPPPDLFSDMNPGTLAETKLPDHIQPEKEDKNIADMYWSNNELSLLPPSGGQPLNATHFDDKQEENAYEKPTSQQLNLVANLDINQSCSEPGEGICLITTEVNKVIPYNGIGIATIF